MAKINQEEYEFLKNLGDQWKWITGYLDGEHGGDVFIYTEKPYKDCNTKIWIKDEGRTFLVDSNLFQFIQWEDDEPYNIAWLLGEYEEAEYGYFNNELYERFYDESVETEVKDSEPLMKYVNREIEMIKETLPHMDRVESEGRKEWHEGFLSALENVRDKFNQLEEPEVLSQELPVVPKFVAEWFEENKEHFDSKLKSVIKYPPLYDEDVTDFTKWVSNPAKKPIQTLGNMFNGYEVAEVQKYYVVKREGLDGVHYYFTKFDDEVNGLFTLPNDKKEAYRFEDKEKAQAIANYTDSEIEEMEE